MIHCIKFEKDRIIYSNKWIRTYRFLTEKKYKSPMFVRLGKLTTVEIFSKFISRILNGEDIFNKYGEGTANTNVIYHAGKLLALNEMDKPYLLRLTDTSFKTKGRYDFNGELLSNMNAHPKIDSRSGEMIGLGYDVIKRICTVLFIDKKGSLERRINIPLRRSTVMHDFGLTHSKIILVDHPLEFNIINILKSSFPIGVTKGMRIGILDRSTYELRWIKTLHDDIIFHIAHCYDDSDGKIIMYAFCYDPDTFDIQQLELERPNLRRFEINLYENSCKARSVSKCRGELPVMDGDYIFYSRISDCGFDAIVRHDIKTNKEDIVYFGEKLYGGECAIYGNYIINILTTQTESLSKLVIYNKTTLQLDRCVSLGLRIPFGFHGLFIKPDEQ